MGLRLHYQQGAEARGCLCRVLSVALLRGQLLCRPCRAGPGVLAGWVARGGWWVSGSLPRGVIEALLRFDDLHTQLGALCRLPLPPAAAGIVCGFIGQGLANSMMLLKRKCVAGGVGWQRHVGGCVLQLPLAPSLALRLV